VRIAKVSRVDELIQNHTGSLLFPPSSVERLKEIGPMDSHELEVRLNNRLGLILVGVVVIILCFVIRSTEKAG
jgi:hypothetical protein